MPEYYKVVAAGTAHETCLIEIPVVFSRAEIGNKHWARTQEGIKTHVCWLLECAFEEAEKAAGK